MSTNKHLQLWAGEIRGQQTIEGKGPAGQRGNPSRSSALLAPRLSQPFLSLRCSVCGRSSGVNTLYNYQTEMKYLEGCFGK